MSETALRTMLLGEPLSSGRSIVPQIMKRISVFVHNPATEQSVPGLWTLETCKTWLDDIDTASKVLASTQNWRVWFDKFTEADRSSGMTLCRALARADEPTEAASCAVINGWMVDSDGQLRCPICSPEANITTHRPACSQTAEVCAKRGITLVGFASLAPGSLLGAHEILALPRFEQSAQLPVWMRAVVESVPRVDRNCDVVAPIASRLTTSIGYRAPVILHWSAKRTPGPKSLRYAQAASLLGSKRPRDDNALSEALSILDEVSRQPVAKTGNGLGFIIKGLSSKNEVDLAPVERLLAGIRGHVQSMMTAVDKKTQVRPGKVNAAALSAEGASSRGTALSPAKPNLNLVAKIGELPPEKQTPKSSLNPAAKPFKAAPAVLGTRAKKEEVPVRQHSLLPIPTSPAVLPSPSLLPPPSTTPALSVPVGSILPAPPKKMPTPKDVSAAADRKPVKGKAKLARGKK